MIILKTIEDFKETPIRVIPISDVLVVVYNSKLTPLQQLALQSNNVIDTIKDKPYITGYWCVGKNDVDVIWSTHPHAFLALPNAPEVVLHASNLVQLVNKYNTYQEYNESYMPEKHSRKFWGRTNLEYINRLQCKDYNSTYESYSTMSDSQLIINLPPDSTYNNIVTIDVQHMLRSKEIIGLNKLTTTVYLSSDIFLTPLLKTIDDNIYGTIKQILVTNIKAICN